MRKDTNLKNVLGTKSMCGGYNRKKTHVIQPVEAPKLRAFEICPTSRIPPSAITGTPNRRAYSATLNTAVPCGLPTAMTSCVIQIEPLPIPTLSPSTPASIRFFAWAAVTTLPPTTWRSAYFSFMYLIKEKWNMLKGITHYSLLPYLKWDQ